MKVLIIGAGAIGGSLAVYISNIAEVVILEKNTKTCEIISENGLSLINGKEILTANCKIVSELSEGDRFDICFTATRAYHLQNAVKSVLPYLQDEARVVAMNNGVCIDELIKVVGQGRAIGCSINYGVGINSPGSYYIKIKGGLVMGMKQPADYRLLHLAELINKSLKCTITNNIIGTLYSKMLINSCITSSAVITGSTLGEILSSISGREFFYRIVKEGVDVAKSEGIEIPRYNGKLDYYKLISNSLWGKLKRRMLLYIMSKKYGTRTSATLEAVRLGGRTETEFYNGYIVELGAKNGIETPINQAVVNVIRQIEQDISLIAKDNIDKLIKADIDKI